MSAISDHHPNSIVDDPDVWYCKDFVFKVCTTNMLFMDEIQKSTDVKI